MLSAARVLPVPGAANSPQPDLLSADCAARSCHAKSFIQFLQFIHQALESVSATFRANPQRSIQQLIHLQRNKCPEAVGGKKYRSVLQEKQTMDKNTSRRPRVPPEL